MTEYTIRNAQCLLGNEIKTAAICIADGMIKTIGCALDTPQSRFDVDLGGDILSPGFVDLQVNGGAGILFNEEPTLEGLSEIAAAHIELGSTSILPTLISDELDTIAQGIDAVRSAMRAGVPGIVGIHIEGPCIDPDRKGIHDEQVFRTMGETELELFGSLEDGVTIVTLSPSVVTPTMIEALAAKGVVVSLGHSNASWRDAQNALNAGATMFTHLHNAMSPMTAREPGMVGAALSSDSAWASLIADGTHVHKTVLANTFRARPKEKTVLVSDAMPCVGADIKEFDLFGQKICVKNGICTGSDGTLAGAAICLHDAVRFVRNEGLVSDVQALLMASRFPAEAVGCSSTIGSISLGARADFVRLDDQLLLVDTCVRGKWLNNVGLRHFGSE